MSAFATRLRQRRAGPAPARGFRRRPELEWLEDRLVPSNIEWINRGPEDGFAAAYGERAAAARQLVDVAITDWEFVIQNFNYSDTDHPNEFRLKVRAADTDLPSIGGGYAVTVNGNPDEEKKPFGAEIVVDDNGWGRGVDAWFFAEKWLTPEQFSEREAYWGKYTGRPPLDFYSTVLHEIGHALGIRLGIGLAIDDYLTPIGDSLYRFEAGPADDRTTAILTAGTGGHVVTENRHELMDQSLFDFTRNLISPLDARILRDAYGYTIWDPDDLPTLEEPPLYQHLHCNYYHPELPPDIDCREFAINVPPTLEEIDDRTVSEGSLLTVQATARDQNPGQVLTFSLGPGAPAGATIHPNTGLFRWTPPDGPTVVTIAVRVSDGDAEGLSDTETFTVTVTNAPPTATFGGPASGVRGQPLSFTGSFSDPGADTWTATVDFGDGTGVQPLALNADKTFAVSHAFAAEGDYTVTFTVKDDDQGTAVVRRAVAIKVWDMPADPTDPSMTALVVGGTPGNDNIQVHPVGSTGSVEVLVNSVSLGTFTPTGRIIIFGQAGDDNIHVATAVANPAELYGGGGNDRINAGSGNTLLTGGEGDDDLIGGNGRDLLLGGMGRDSLLGANGDDILIGGVTAWDNDPQALRAILSEWTRTDRDYRERVTDLQNGGGLNGSYKLNADFVFADGAEDRLTGGGDLDFVFYDALDSVIGLLEKEEGILVD